MDGENASTAAPPSFEDDAGGLRTYGRETLQIVRVMILGGLPLGVLFGGVLGRLAMALLVQTSPSWVRGLRSDDDFVIGQFTVGGTYNLLVAAAAAGFLSAAFYLWIVRYLRGSTWLRDLTVALVAGVLGGALIIQSEGVDFFVLEPNWLAVAMFMVIPALYGLFIGPVVRRVESPTSWVHEHRFRFLPVALVALFPLVVVVLIPAAVIAFVWCILRANPMVAAARRRTLLPALGAAFWVVLITLGVVNLIEDFDAIF